MDGPAFIPGRHSPHFARFFAWYAGRLFAKRFFAVRLAAGTDRWLREVADRPGPVIVAMNHSAWWDPLTALLLGDRLMPGRSACSPMDARVLEKVRFFTRLGVFGIDPDDAGALRPMLRHVAERFERDERPTLWITPQGNFTDVRRPVTLRAGLAAIAARAPGVVAVSLAVEYAFWDDQKPEVFARLAPVPAPDPPDQPRDWHDAFTRAMNDNAHALAQLVAARDPGAFDTLLGGRAERLHPVYDAWKRLLGRRGSGIATRRPPPPTPARPRPGESGEVPGGKPVA